MNIDTTDTKDAFLIIVHRTKMKDGKFAIGCPHYMKGTPDEMWETPPIKGKDIPFEEYGDVKKIMKQILNGDIFEPYDA